MKFKENDYYVFAASGFAVSIMLSFLKSWPYSIVAFGISALLMIKMKRAGSIKGGRISIETSMFIKNLIANYLPKKSVLGIIEKSLDDGWQISGMLKKPLCMYALSGDAMQSFAGINLSSSELLKKLVAILMLGLDTGADILMPLSELDRLNEQASEKGAIGMAYIKNTTLSELDRLNEQASEKGAIGMAYIKNTTALVSIGTVFFLPVFAGISVSILGISQDTGGNFSVALPISLILGAYLIMINYIQYNQAYGNLHEAKIANASFASAGAMLIMKLTSMLALAII
jgi:hypothetical protein